MVKEGLLLWQIMLLYCIYFGYYCGWWVPHEMAGRYWMKKANASLLMQLRALILNVNFMQISSWTSVLNCLTFKINFNNVSTVEFCLELLRSKFPWTSFQCLIVRVKKISMLASLSHTNLVLWWPVLGMPSLSTSSNFLWFLWNCFHTWKWILCIQSALITILCWFCERLYMERSLFHKQLKICYCIFIKLPRQLISFPVTQNAVQLL